jgi:cation:H+ antiporter
LNRRFLAVSIILSIFFAFFSLVYNSFPLWLDIIGIILGIIALYISGDVFLEEALRVGIKYGISSKSVGTYIISFGAVIDEFAVVFSSSIRGYGSLSFGTIQGSNVITLIIFLPILAMVARKNFSGFRKDGYVLLAVSLVALAMSVQWIRDPWYLGIPMIAIYAVYALVNRRPAENLPQKTETGVDYVAMAAALILLGFAAEALVDYTVAVSHIAGIASFYSGFIITGVAGSLPEIIMFGLIIVRKDGDATLGITTGTTIYKGSLILGISILFGTVNLSLGRWSIILMSFLALIFIFLSFVRIRKIYAVLPLFAIAATYLVNLMI